MNRDDIIRMAREAGDIWEDTLPQDQAFLIRFAALAIAAEREACARAASIALLGADKSLSDRVVNAIRSRGQRE
jgi:hypothetical protein